MGRVLDAADGKGRLELKSVKSLSPLRSLVSAVPLLNGATLARSSRLMFRLSPAYARSELLR